MAEIFPLFVSYQQVAVFNHGLDSPFNDWGPRHVSQGFSWRAVSASFRVPEGEMCLVEVLQDSEASVLPGLPTREILTPFERLKDDSITVGSITEEHVVAITGGQKYQISFELLPGGIYADETYDCFIRLRFMKNDNAIFELRKADADMDTSSPLDLHATPAG